MVQKIKTNSSNELYNNLNDESRVYDIEANVHVMNNVVNNLDSGRVTMNGVILATFNWWGVNSLNITYENLKSEEQIEVLNAVNVFVAEVRSNAVKANNENE